MRLPAALRPGSQPPRLAGRRDRHGRGIRGATSLPGPVTPGGLDYPTGSARRFDDLVLTLAAQLTHQWRDQLGEVEFGVEEVPLLPRDWATDGEVPLATLMRPMSASPARIVLFRRPIEHRAASGEELAGLVLAVLIEQVATLLDRDPAEVDSRYGD